MDSTCSLLRLLRTCLGLSLPLALVCAGNVVLTSESPTAAARSGVCHQLNKRFGQVHFLHSPVCKLVQQYEQDRNLLDHHPPLKSGVFVKVGPNALPCRYANIIGHSKEESLRRMEKELASSASVAVNHVKAGYLRKALRLSRHIDGQRGGRRSNVGILFPTLLHRAEKLADGLKKLMPELGENSLLIDNTKDVCTQAKARRKADKYLPNTPAHVRVSELEVHGELKSYCLTLTALQQTLRSTIESKCPETSPETSLPTEN